MDTCFNLSNWIESKMKGEESKREGEKKPTNNEIEAHKKTHQKYGEGGKGE